MIALRGSYDSSPLMVEKTEAERGFTASQAQTQTHKASAHATLTLCPLPTMPMAPGNAAAAVISI